MNNREQILHFYLMGWDDCSESNDENVDSFNDGSVFSRAYRFGWRDCKDGSENRCDGESDDDIIKMVLSDD